MPPNLRSVIERVTRGGRSVVSRRNFSSSLSRNAVIVVSEGSGNSAAYSVVRFLSIAVGYGFGYCLYGDKLSELGENRQKNLRKDSKGECEEIVDLREKIWERVWLDVKKNMGFVRKS